MSDDDHSEPPSKGRRMFEMAKMTASVAGDYTSSRVKAWFQSDEEGRQSRKEAQRRTGERLADTLGDLKGAAMKIGQMASVATDLLPAEIAEPLEELQRDAPPMDYEVVADQIESELGAPPDLLYDSFEREPFASASIGQVHRAEHDGRRVVVKVQYPGIDESVGTDLSQVKMALQFGGFVDGEKREAFDQLFEEIAARLQEELDYTNEAENVRLFRRLHEDDTKLVLPEVVGERSAKRVLTLTEQTGDDLEEVRESYSWAQKDAVGETLFRMFSEQMFVHATLHADPNPANFAFRPDGTVVLYDFGCIKELADGQYRALVDILRAGLDSDWNGLEQGLIDLGARVPSKPALPDEVYRRWRRIFLEPVLDTDDYDYGDDTIYRRFRDNMETFLEYESHFQPPPGGIYVDRTVVGIHNILRKLECRVPCERLVRHYLQLAEENLDDD